jgi:hypothetical protein
MPVILGNAGCALVEKAADLAEATFTPQEGTMSAETLPIDIIGHILGFLQSDIKALKACAHSHPILSDLSERYIYADVTLRDDTFSSFDLPTSEFSQLLAKKPYIANFVRSLEVVCVYGTPGSVQHEMTSSHFDGITSLLPMLAVLTKFIFRGSFVSSSPFPWHAVPRPFCQAFLHHLHLKDIVIIHVTSFPMELLNDRRNIKVSLDHCDNTQYNRKKAKLNNASESYPGPFEHLSVSRCSDRCVKSIATWVELHGLRSLKYADYGFTNSFQRLLVACSNSLTDLHINDSHCMFPVRLLKHIDYICFFFTRQQSSASPPPHPCSPAPHYKTHDVHILAQLDSNSRGREAYLYYRVHFKDSVNQI